MVISIINPFDFDKEIFTVLLHEGILDYKNKNDDSFLCFPQPAYLMSVGKSWNDLSRWELSQCQEYLHDGDMAILGFKTMDKEPIGMKIREAIKKKFDKSYERHPAWNYNRITLKNHNVRSDDLNNRFDNSIIDLLRSQAVIITADAKVVYDALKFQDFENESDDELSKILKEKIKYMGTSKNKKNKLYPIIIFTELGIDEKVETMFKDYLEGKDKRALTDMFKMAYPKTHGILSSDNKHVEVKEPRCFASWIKKGYNFRANIAPVLERGKDGVEHLVYSKEEFMKMFDYIREISDDIKDKNSEELFKEYAPEWE